MTAAVLPRPHPVEGLTVPRVALFAVARGVPRPHPVPGLSPAAAAPASPGFGGAENSGTAEGPVL